MLDLEFIFNLFNNCISEENPVWMLGWKCIHRREAFNNVLLRVNVVFSETEVV